jgi:hypothetical protein
METFYFCALSEMDITAGFEPAIGGSNPSGRKGKSREAAFAFAQ